MPKLSEERKEQRREEILAAARRAFAEHGYERATVARLERETGLSRGAIFNYFAAKEDIFLALAEHDAQRLGRIWLEEGWEAALRELLTEDPAWLGAYVEIGRRLRTDDEFRRRWEGRGPNVERDVKAALRRDQKAGTLRADVPVDVIGQFLGLVFDGIALQRAAGFTPEHPERIVTLVASAIGGRAPRRTRARRRA